MGDHSRYLPAVDPGYREIFLSFGAFRETLDQSARALGHEPQINVTAKSRHASEIATIRLEKAEGMPDQATLNLISSTYTPKGNLHTERLTSQDLGTLYASQEEKVRYVPRDQALSQWVHEEAPKAALHQAWRDPVQEEPAGYLHFSRKTAKDTGYGMTPGMMALGPFARTFWYAFMSRKTVPEYFFCSVRMIHRHRSSRRGDCLSKLSWRLPGIRKYAALPIRGSR